MNKAQLVELYSVIGAFCMLFGAAFLFLSVLFGRPDED